MNEMDEGPEKLKGGWRKVRGKKKKKMWLESNCQAHISLHVQPCCVFLLKQNSHAGFLCCLQSWADTVVSLTRASIYNILFLGVCLFITFLNSAPGFDHFGVFPHWCMTILCVHQRILAACWGIEMENGGTLCRVFNMVWSVGVSRRLCASHLFVIIAL